jgi:hypothetical protein
MPATMKQRQRLVPVLVGLVAIHLLLGAVSRPARAAEDLVKATAALVLAEEPPPTRSQLLEQKRKEDEEKARNKKPEVDDTPVYKKWWFWAMTGAVVGGTVLLGAWAIKPSTQPAKACPNGSIGCFGDGRR